MLESAACSDNGTSRRFLAETRSRPVANHPTHEMLEARKSYLVSLFDDVGLVSRTRMHIKQPRFDSVNAVFSVANVNVELLRTKNVHEASVLRFGSAGALRAAR